MGNRSATPFSTDRKEGGGWAAANTSLETVAPPPPRGVARPGLPG